MEIAIRVLKLVTALVFMAGSTRIVDAQSAELPADVLANLPQDRKGQILIYGAYGYTGSGISRLAAEYGITPVLSGRNASKLKALADEVGYDYITLSLEDNHQNLVRVLKQFELVMHIAGPYTYTSEPMINAAIEAQTHYVDLTGENHVIQAQLDRDQEFIDAGIMVMPAVGYDVVPTDCLNFYVAKQIDKPTKLTLVMNGNYTEVEGAATSRGTLKSGLEMLSRPIMSRQNGEMVEMGQAKVVKREVDGKVETLVQIPWADMMTSWVSTGVPNIETYQVQDGELPGWVLWLSKREWGKNMLVWMIDKFSPEGPPPEAQEKRQTQLVATASNAAGESFTAEMITPEAYLLTFHSALIIAKNILDGQWQLGFQTPAKVYGPDLALQVPGVVRRDL